MKVKKICRILFLFLTLSAFSHCFSIQQSGTSIIEDGAPDLYGGVRMHLTTWFGSGNAVLAHNPFVILLIFDLPFSLVLDTALFPFWATWNIVHQLGS